MKIDTKLDIGDNACFLYKRKVCYGNVSKIEIEVALYIGTDIQYYCDDVKVRGHKETVILCEHEIFKTKKELLDSL